MSYPDGSETRVGDLIWWDEGHCVGYVQAVAEAQEDYERWGEDAPFIFVSNRHPFDPSVEAGIAYDAASFEDEGIGLLSASERKEFGRASDIALHGRDISCFSVTTLVENHTFKSWIFTLQDLQGREILVAVPYEKPAA